MRCFTSPLSRGTILENAVVQITSVSATGFLDAVLLKNSWQSPAESAKYCHGNQVFPSSIDLSRVQTPGLGEFPIVMNTYATWNSYRIVKLLI